MRWILALIFACMGLCASEEEGKTPEKLRRELLAKYQEAESLRSAKADEAKFKILLDEVKEIKQKILKNDQEFISKNTEMKDESGFWDQGETTLSSLIVEYGSGDHLYIIPPELCNMKLQLFSMIPIPRAVWDEMLEFILSQNGIGVRKINNFAKQLFILKHDPSVIYAITDSYEDLQLIEDHQRVLYIISPPFEKIKSTQSFFEKFSDPKITTIQTIGSKVVIISQKQNLVKLISIYKAVWESDQEKVIKVCQFSKLPIQEAEKILKTFFDANDSKPRPSIYKSIVDELCVISLKNALVLIGEGATVNRAESILKDLEEQLQDPKEMTVYWYQCKHTDPEDLARLLDQVYDSLSISQNFPKKQLESKRKSSSPEKESEFCFGNFIVDIKTSSIMMVIKRDDIDKIKAILKKLDVPKRMVEIEVLLVEKKEQDRKKTGINLLKLGSQGQEKNYSLTFDTDPSSKRKGLLDFILQTPKASFPAFDLAFSLLMAQENVCLHANPTLIAMNQTPATLSIVEEISINNGAVQIDSKSNLALEKSFTRAQYGTTIMMTPMIHFAEEEYEEENGFVTLSTNITFETTQMSQDDRPPVTRRHIENEVRIPDGETIVIGGLRRKSNETSREKIPFLGDIPGLGKLFGTTKSSENNTEMFIFITPRILKDPSAERKNLKKAKLSLRPGDSGDILKKIQEAKAFEKSAALQDGIHLLFDSFN